MGACSSRDFDTDKDEQKEIRRKNAKLAAYGKNNYQKSLRYNDSDIILFSYNGDLMTLRSAKYKKEMPDILTIRGFSQDINLIPKYSNASSH